MDNEKFQNNEERIAYLDNQLNKLTEHQEAELLIDFDAAIEEHKSKPYKIKFNNKDFIIPREMPFNFGTFFFRHCYKRFKGKIEIEVPEDKMLEFIKLMFGNEMLRELEKRNDIDMLFVFENLAKPILDKWGYKTEEQKNKFKNNTKKKI